MLFVDIEARDYAPMATSRGLASLPDKNGMTDWLRILYPDLASQSFDLSISCDGKDVAPGEPIPEDFARLTVHVDLPSSAFGNLAGADPTMNSQSRRSSEVSTKRPSESTTPTSVKKTKSSGIDPDEVNQALQAAASPPRPTIRDHGKDRETFQRVLGTAAMVRDQCCVVTRNTNPTQLECAHVLPPPAAEIFFRQPGAPRTCAIPVVNKRDTGPDWCPSYDVRNSMMLQRNLHSGYDDFAWSVTGSDGIFSVFLFTDTCDGVEHGARLKFPLPVEGAPAKYRTTYIDQFPDGRTFRRHFEEAVRRHFKAAGTPDRDSDRENARTNDYLQHEREESDSEIDSDPEDFMFTKARPLRTDSNLTIGEILSIPGYE
ncbi:hypothetical protein HDU87_001499 [Geranomyces variabilis]|uniref:HNH nuclease domain-containing protein n=1 Tax=Geranomyces variabilis TaxID=109894 RepID=A0AAD5TB18_9FUNG|nr:hypothetical protein HDU87_001499 [Geranomyces variabilis]